MSKFEWEATEARFHAAMERMRCIIEEYASFQKALDEKETFLAKRRARLRGVRAHFASIAHGVSETRRNLEALRTKTEDEEANALELEKRLSQQFGQFRDSW